MTTTTHPTTVIRIMSLAAPADDAGVARLAQGQGVLSVEVVKNGKALRLTYDLQHTELAALAHLAEASGLKLSAGSFAWLARAWSEFQDGNLRSQIKVVHQCCSTPPRA